MFVGWSIAMRVFLVLFLVLVCTDCLCSLVNSFSDIKDLGINLAKEKIFRAKRDLARKNRKRKDATKNNVHKYIVHIDKSKISSQGFVDHLHRHFGSVPSDSIETQSTYYNSETDAPQKRVVDTHIVHHVLDAVIVSGLTEDEVNQLPHVVRVVRDSVKRISGASYVLPWGLDRVNQDNLPLDGLYYSNYTGSNIDVYVVDTGIDTLHVEFQNLPGSTRVVKNVYNAFTNPRTSPTLNTDDVGHGTHVSGTIGGLRVGLSPNANLYGLKILNSEGQGSSSDVVLALDYVASLAQTSGRRSLVSMSLGGPCEDETSCSTDSVVQAVESITAKGIIVSVAAGNDGCNGCYGSPNSAPHAITGKP